MAEIVNPLNDYEGQFLVRDHLADSYTCPWCFTEKTLREFLSKDGKMFSLKRALCMGCSQKMSVQLLTRRQNIYEYIRWLELTAGYDYANKIRWSKIIKNLESLNSPLWIRKKVERISKTPRWHIPRL